MTGKRWKTMCSLLLLMLVSLPALAAMQIERTQNVSLPKAALDVVASADGSRLFVLLKGGEVQVLSPAGETQERLTVSADAEKLAVSPDGERLFVSAGSTLQVIDLATVVTLPVENSPVRGPVDAPVTFTVFSDFQCPYCARLGPFLDEVVAKYPKEVRIVFKQFPLRMHNFAQPAALASLAARNQGKFWPLHDKLFANFSQLSEEKIRALAQEVGLDMVRFGREVKSPELLKEVQRDIDLGATAGVKGTPTIFVNGKILRERSMAGVQELVERELAKSR